MNSSKDPVIQSSRIVSLLIFAAALLVAGFSAKPYADSWNDGSRLAAVEALVDHGAWSIDDSIFVKPAPGSPEAAGPYRDPALKAGGTRDKLWIGGHYYSDKPPVLSLLMAAIYKSAQFATGLTARTHPGLFCWLMTFLTSGIAYAVSVACIDRLSVVFRLHAGSRFLLVLSFALATTALPYSRHVNSHIVLLAVCCALMAMIALPEEWSAKKLAAAGCLAGFGYALDLGAGPVLVICLAALVAFRTRRIVPVILLLMAAFPWFALHHWLNYRLCGGFWPANSNPEFFSWPGSPFSAENLTGFWRQRGFLKTVRYALDLVFGRSGFFEFNPALFLVLPGTAVLFRLRVKELPGILFSVCFFTGTWLLYSLASSNHSGMCLSVRWFVPLLGPAFYLLAVLLHHRPDQNRNLRILTAGGLIMGALMWWHGPWGGRMLPGFWFITAGTLLTWLASHLRHPDEFNIESRR